MVELIIDIMIRVHETQITFIESQNIENLILSVENQGVYMLLRLIFLAACNKIVVKAVEYPWLFVLLKLIVKS